jgi:hypothetical protein
MNRSPQNACFLGAQPVLSQDLIDRQAELRECLRRQTLASPSGVDLPVALRTGLTIDFDQSPLDIH